LKFRKLKTDGGKGSFQVAKVPGGWLIQNEYALRITVVSLVFIPDPEHKWDGREIPTGQHV